MIKADKKPDVKLVEERTVEVQGYEGLYFQLDEGDKSTIQDSGRCCRVAVVRDQRGGS